jgi:response regulator RpfG family c-di-GMP phosphodiesterase
VIRQSEPDLVFLDRQMPGLSGFDVIRNLEPGQRIPVFVVVTACDYRSSPSVMSGWRFPWTAPSGLAGVTKLWTSS